MTMNRRTGASQLNRFRQIDILRAVAVLLVLGRHLTPCPEGFSHFLHHVTRIWNQGGWIGVDLFFVLSGFLVSGLLFREHEKFHELHIGHFLIRRGFKIYPPFWLLIGATVLVAVLRHEELPSHALARELLFVQNYGGLWGHTWSLAVEEHFYFLLAFGMFVLTRRRSTQPFALIPVAFFTVALLCMVLRIMFSEHYHAHLIFSDLRLDGLLFGVFLSYLFHHHQKNFVTAAKRFRVLLAGIGVLLFVPAFFVPWDSTPFIYTYGLTLFYIGSGCLVVAALGSQEPRNGFMRAVAYIGSHSYSVYLWHMPIAIYGTALFNHFLGKNHNWLIYAGTYLAGSVLIGVGMANLTEFPVLRLRDRLFPSRGTPKF